MRWTAGWSPLQHQLSPYGPGAHWAAPQVQKSLSEAGGCPPQPQGNTALPRQLRAAPGCRQWPPPRARWLPRGWSCAIVLLPSLDCSSAAFARRCVTCPLGTHRTDYFILFAITFCIFEDCNHIFGPHTPRLNKSSPAHPFPQTTVSRPQTILPLLQSSTPWSVPSLTGMQLSSQGLPAARGEMCTRSPQRSRGSQDGPHAG